MRPNIRVKMEQPVPNRIGELFQQFERTLDRLEMALGELSEAIVRIDRLGHICWCNDRFAKLLDMPRSQLIGRDLVELLPLEHGGRSVERARHPVCLALATDLSATSIYRWQPSDRETVPLEIFWTGFAPTAKDGGALLVLRQRYPQPSPQSRTAIYQFLAEHTTDWITRQTTDGVLLYASPACQRLLNYSPEALIGQSAIELYHPDDRPRAQQCYHQLFGDGDTPVTFLARIRHANEYYLWLETTLNAVQSSSSHVVREIVAVARDVTDRLSYQTTLQRSERRVRALIEHITDAIVILDRRGDLRYASPSLEKLLGYPGEACIGQPTLPIVCEGDRRAVRQVFRRVLRRENASDALQDFEVYHANGTRVALEATLTNLLSEPAVEGIVLNCHDITERKQAENQLRHDALHDALTGLPNRTLFVDRLSQAIAQRQRHPDWGFAVFYLDIDRFKVVNDSLGHVAGDRLLVEVAQRLARYVRQGDTVARLSGDEFAVLLPDINDESSAQTLANRLQHCLQAPLELSHQQIAVTASIGIALASERDRTPSDLLRDADTAMYRAKQLGKARQELFDATMSQNTLKLLRLGVDLRSAIGNEGLKLYYQPIVALSSGRICGFEALLRWSHPELGKISPNEFVPIAEDTGAIVPLGWWTLHKACQQMKAWRDRFPDRALTMCVNLSGRQFAQPALVEQVVQVLRDTQLDPQFLKLEITETTISENADLVLDVLNRLKAMGVEFSIDDFGTGYSSLSRLQHFPIDTLKIDRSFVGTMDTEPGNLTITKSVVLLATALEISTVAEGVETPDHLKTLRDLGCPYAQGYWFSRPVDGDRMTELLAEDPQW